jgi:hypothetical protein
MRLLQMKPFLGLFWLKELTQLNIVPMGTEQHSIEALADRGPPNRNPWGLDIFARPEPMAV